MQAIPALARGALILTVNANDTVQIGVLPDSPKMGESEQCTLTRPYGLNNQTDRVRATFQACERLLQQCWPKIFHNCTLMRLCRQIRKEKALAMKGNEHCFFQTNTV